MYMLKSVFGSNILLYYQLLIFHQYITHKVMYIFLIILTEGN